MKENKIVKLSDVCDLIPGFAFKSSEFGEHKVKAVKIGDIQPPYVNFESMTGVDISKYSVSRLAKYEIFKGDFVLAMTGATIGKIGRYITDTGAYINQRVLKFKPHDEVNSDFIYYVVSSTSFQKYILNNVDSETAQPNISAGSVGKYEFELPSLEEQNRIANILASIDNKIQLNRQINDNLEQQAQALYKSWFVDFDPFKDGAFKESEFGLIPGGWRVGSLSDLTEITMGQSPSGKSYNETGDGMLFYQGRAEFGDRYPSIRLYTTEPSRIAEQNSVLLSVRAPVGDTNIAYNKCCIGRGLASITAKHGFNSFIFYMIKSLKDQFDLYNGEGTVFGSINRDSLNSMKVIVPTNEVINDFEKIVAPLDFKYKSLFSENLLLMQQRDTLLPKLMSGELKINDLDC